MSTENTDQVQLTDTPLTKPRYITCFIHYNNDDDQTQIFEVLKTFRKEKGLKFSHHHGYIFFTLLSSYLDEFSKLRPFKISRFQTKSEFKCSKEVADTLMAQKDSFIRMNWNESTSVLTFLSRTISRVHNQLIKRIFTDSKVEFVRSQYTVLKDESIDEVSSKSKPSVTATENATENATDDFTMVKNFKARKNSSAKSSAPRDKTKYNKKSQPTDKPLIRGKK